MSTTLTVVMISQVSTYVKLIKLYTLVMYSSLCANYTSIKLLFKKRKRASLIVQWLRIRLPMQGTRVRAVVWEDPTCRRAMKPVGYNY